jgi:hypothetical protein
MFLSLTKTQLAELRQAKGDQALVVELEDALRELRAEDDR